MRLAEVGPRVVEVISEIEPADGVSVFQALLDAKPSGYESITITGNQATILWYKERNGDL